MEVSTIVITGVTYHVDLMTTVGPRRTTSTLPGRSQLFFHEERGRSEDAW